MRSSAVRLFLSGVCMLSASGATLGRVVPLTTGASDLVLDDSRSRVYLIGSVLNQVQIYSIQKQAVQSTVATDATPLSAALSRDGNSLYVACYDASLLDVVEIGRAHV